MGLPFQSPRHELPPWDPPLRRGTCGTIAEVLSSQVCSRASLESLELTGWAERLWPALPSFFPGIDGANPKRVPTHRKMWEWLFICQTLAERGMLAPGRRGLGFGVGREPLVSLFAGLGCEIVATDLHSGDAEAAGWAASGQYSGGLDGLNEHGLCSAEAFAQRVSFRNVNMTQIPADLYGFDFTWSSCAFEHLGSLAAGASFVMDQMRCLRPGGVGVHTTELNVSSDDRTVEEGGVVLFRRRDLIDLSERLRRQGYRIELDLTEGTTAEDRHVDVPPFTEVHLRTAVGEFVTTSVGLIVERPTRLSRGSLRRLLRR